MELKEFTEYLVKSIAKEPEMVKKELLEAVEKQKENFNFNNHNKNELIFQQGDEAENFCIILIFYRSYK